MASQSNSTSIPASQVAAPAAQSESKQKPATRAPRPQKPNYRHIHRFPLPISVHPLPPLIPHNPLSLVSVLLSYLTYLIAPPHDEVHSAYFDPDTSSVHVTEEKAIKALWEMGFFGKGTLSRSHPNWLEQEKKRRGLLGGITSEEVTRQRRSERRELKLERARMEKVAIEERLKAEAAAKVDGDMSLDRSAPSPSADGVTNGTTSTAERFSLKKARQAKFLESRDSVARDMEAHAPDSLGKPNGKTVRFSPIVQTKEISSDSTVAHLPDFVDGLEPDEEAPLQNEEHLQLSNEEAFFLAYGTGTLRVYDGKSKTVLSPASLLSTFCHHSYFPPRDSSLGLNPDDPFLISYVVYHHFRSLGWVVRSGVKFGVDYLLYNRGPVFSHAEFAVVVIPSYVHPYWYETEDRRTKSEEKQARSWWWFHCVNRVQAQVRKSLVVCYVEVPPPAPSAPETPAADDIGGQLARYRVRELVIRRWIPNRSRD